MHKKVCVCVFSEDRYIGEGAQGRDITLGIMRVPPHSFTPVTIAGEGLATRAIIYHGNSPAKLPW